MPSFSNQSEARGSAAQEEKLSLEQRQLRMAYLIECLREPDALARHDAARALGQIGPEAVPALDGFLRSQCAASSACLQTCLEVFAIIFKSTRIP
jgi:HEAT repeat protein